MANPVKVLVRKLKGRHAGHHGGAWKVAYADFVTAMMAFFLVMWIVGLNQTVKNAIASYFKDPVGFMRAIERGNKPIEVDTPGLLSYPDVAPDIRKDRIGARPRSKAEERKKFGEVKKGLEKIIGQSPDLKDLAKSVRINIVDAGLRIDLVESAKDLFFDSGSAAMKPRTCKLLQRVARELGELPNRVVIEGHTDSRPYAGPNGWTNWELSTARANAARAVMETSGLQAGQVIEVRGLADRMPLDPGHRDSFRNRRVSMLLPFSERLKQVKE